MRLEQGVLGVSHARPEPRPQPHLGRHVDRRIRGIRGSHDYVRKRRRCRTHAAAAGGSRQWKVPVAELAVSNGVITHAKSGRTTTYGKVAAAAAELPTPDMKEIKLKDPKDWKVAGKPAKRLDTMDKLTGKQLYAVDVTLPGMLNASIMDAPVYRRQGQELRRGQGQGDARRAACRARRATPPS